MSPERHYAAANAALSALAREVMPLLNSASAESRNRGAKAFLQLSGALQRLGPPEGEFWANLLNNADPAKNRS